MDEEDEIMTEQPDEPQEPPRAFYARFFLWLDIVLLALLALLWVLNNR